MMGDGCRFRFRRSRRGLAAAVFVVSFSHAAWADVLPPPPDPVDMSCPKNSHHEVKDVAACAGDKRCVARLPCVSDFSGEPTNTQLTPIGPSSLPGTPPLEGTALGK